MGLAYYPIRSFFLLPDPRCESLFSVHNPALWRKKLVPLSGVCNKYFSPTRNMFLWSDQMRTPLNIIISIIKARCESMGLNAI